MNEARAYPPRFCESAVNVCCSSQPFVNLPGAFRSSDSTLFPLGLLRTLTIRRAPMPSVRSRKLAGAVGKFFLAAVTIVFLSTYSFAGSGTLTVSGTQWGITSQNLGANEGSSQFNINDLVDLGINTYRMYGGMSRWEPTDAESTYGSPTIAQIEANPAVINWAFYDNIFTNPPGGSDYRWSASTGIPPVSAATIMSDLNAHNITPIIVLRNRDNNGNPTWSPNPP